MWAEVDFVVYSYEEAETKGTSTARYRGCNKLSVNSVYDTCSNGEIDKAASPSS